MERLANMSLGKLTALCTLLAVGVVTVTHGQQMFSSGPLSESNRRKVLRGGVNSHAEIGSNCAACHAAPWSSGGMADRCMDCHTDIRDAIDKKAPMHGMLANGKDCMTCHTEHKGPYAALTSFHLFDHECAGFKLSGKHVGLDCKSCHKSELYKGTPSKCESCHAEPKVHKGKFGLDCMSCHSTTNWASKVTEIKNFDHSVTRFPLTGKHLAVDCKSCHKNEEFVGTPTSCISCHAEPAAHKGKYGFQCAQCHTTSDWSGIQFHHNFPITHGGATKTGKSCSLCHLNVQNFASYTCYGCHHHTPQKEAKRHANRKMTVTLESCATCHPTGRRAIRKVELDTPMQGLCMACPGQSSSGDVFSLSYSKADTAKIDMAPLVATPTDRPPMMNYLNRVLDSHGKHFTLFNK